MVTLAPTRVLASLTALKSIRLTAAFSLRMLVDCMRVRDGAGTGAGVGALFAGVSAVASQPTHSKSNRQMGSRGINFHSSRYLAATRQCDTSGHFLSSSFAHAVVLPVWQEVQGLGILNRSVIAGVMNLKVWLRTLTLAIVCSIFGMWQFTHSFPADPALW